MSYLTIKVTEASQDAVNFVLENLWERGAQELALLGYSLDMANATIRLQRESGMPTLAIWIDGEPVVISGLLRADHPAAMRTWFQATEAFAQYARPITKVLRDQLEETAKDQGLEFIEILSPCVHEKTGRWFKALGFDLDVNRYMTLREGSDQRLYRFERRFDTHVLPQA